MGDVEPAAREDFVVPQRLYRCLEQGRGHRGERADEFGAGSARPAQHGDRERDPADVVGLGGQADPHRRHQQIPARPLDERGVDVLPVGPGLGERAEQPVQQEGTARAGPRAGLREFDRRRAAERGGDDLGDFAGAERAQVQRVAQATGEEVGERGLGVAGFAGALGQQHQHRQVLGSAQQEAQPEQGTLVAPMHVVDDQGERAHGGQVDSQPIEPVLDGEWRLVTVPGLGKGGKCQFRATRQVLAGKLVEECPDSAVPGVAVHLGAGRAEHREVAEDPVREHRVQQARLTDSGRPAQHERPRVTRPDGLGQPDQPGGGFPACTRFRGGDRDILVVDHDR